MRTAGERTEKECIRRASRQGKVIVINKSPFGEAVRETFRIGSKLNQKWIPVIDADVLLKDGRIQDAIDYLEEVDRNHIFCLDGRTKDKTMMKVRRAGVHIYRSKYMARAVKFVNNNHIKPESQVRRIMSKLGFKTVSPKKIVFGYHDYEQYYKDLFRKAFVQTRKLNKMLKRNKIFEKWKKRAKKDKDYKIILEGNRIGRHYIGQVVIDKNQTYGAMERLRTLGIKEKDEII